MSQEEVDQVMPAPYSVRVRAPNGAEVVIEQNEPIDPHLLAELAGLAMGQKASPVSSRVNAPRARVGSNGAGEAWNPRTNERDRAEYEQMMKKAEAAESGG